MRPFVKKYVAFVLLFWGLLNAQAGSDWQPLHLGEAAADGTLYLRLPLAEIQIGSNSQPFEVQHRLRAELDGSCWSEWFLPQLQASLVPANKGEMRLTLPGGMVATFKTELLATKLFTVLSKGGLRGRRMDDDSLEFEAEARYYRFRKGVLLSIDYGAEATMRAEADGLRIKTLTPSTGLTLVRLDYDEFGNPAHGRIDGHEIRFIHDDRTGLLQRVEKDGRTLYSFEYANQVVSRYRDREGAWQTVEWIANRRHDSGIRAELQFPLILSRVGTSAYSFVFRRTGAVILRTLATGRRDRLIIDYMRNIILRDELDPPVNYEKKDE